MTIVWKLKGEFYVLDSQSVAWQMFIQNSFCPLTEIRPQVLSLMQDLNSIVSVMVLSIVHIGIIKVPFNRIALKLQDLLISVVTKCQEFKL